MKDCLHSSKGQHIYLDALELWFTTYRLVLFELRSEPKRPPARSNFWRARTARRPVTRGSEVHEHVRNRKFQVYERQNWEVLIKIGIQFLLFPCQVYFTFKEIWKKMDTCQIYIVFTFNFVVILTRCGLIGFFTDNWHMFKSSDRSKFMFKKARTVRGSVKPWLGPLEAR